jgi:hypothetical protein
MGGSVQGIGGPLRAIAGGKSSGRGQSGYGQAQGFTPVGQAPARTDAPVQQTAPTPQEPQYTPGSAMGGGFGPQGNPGFPSPFGGGMGGGFGGKSSGLGGFGMQQSPYGQMGFNPYAQQPMQQQFMAPQLSPALMYGLPAILGALRGGYFAEGGEIKEDDEE